jgi:hypothetical protein
MHRIVVGLLILVVECTVAVGGEVLDPEVPSILNLREQAELRDAWLAKRLDTVVPMLMRREGIDMWLLIAREYNEDPVIETMLPATWLSSRRRTVLIFYDTGTGMALEKLAVSRYAPGEQFVAAWLPEEEPDQWVRIAKLIAERNPRRIAVNQSEVFPLADGLSAGEAKALVAAIGEKYTKRLVTAEKLAIGWLETRIADEMLVYPTLVRIAHAIIAEGLSEKVVTPGITTTSDIAWWYRERLRGLGLDTWFHPGVSLDRADVVDGTKANQFADKQKSSVILPGDFLHVDFGITYLGLNTDTQHHAYVLLPGETAAPDGLVAGIAAGNRVQDILMSNFRSGISGNDLQAQSRREAIDAGLNATIYSHAIGLHGHGAGPWIGMWDDQLARPPVGDYQVFPNTAWSIELNVQLEVPEWGGKVVQFKSEEDAYFDGKNIQFLDGRQEELHLIPRQ